MAFHSAVRRPRTRSPGAPPLRVDGVRDPVRADGRRLRGPAGRRLHVLAPQGPVEPVRRPARRAGIDRVGHRGAGRRTALAPGRPLEPRQEHLPDGAGLEPRHHLLRVRGELLASARRARHRRRRRSGLRHGRRRVPRHAVSVADAKLGARRVLSRRHPGLRAGRRPRRLHRRALGLAGRLRRGRHPRIDPRLRVPAHRARLQDGRAAHRGRRRRTRPCRGARHRDRAAAAAHRARRVHRRRLPAPHAVDDLRVAADVLQPLLRPRPRSGGTQGRARGARRRRRRRALGHRLGPPDAAHRVRPPVCPGGRRRADGRAHGHGVRTLSPRQRAIRADPRRRPDDGGQRRPDHRRRDRRRASRRPRHGGIGFVAHPEPVRTCGRPPPDRTAFG